MEGAGAVGFEWISLLGASAALFLLAGVLYLVIGFLTPIFAGRQPDPAYLLTGPRADRELFHEPPARLLSRVPEVSTIRYVLVRWVGALLVGIGILVIALAWFGLREGERWALVALGASELAMLPILYLSYGPFRDAGVSVGLTELPPYQWIPAVTVVPATILGWIATR